MNGSGGKEASQVLVEFADVVTCPFTHSEPAAFLNSVKLMYNALHPSPGLTSSAAIWTFMFSSLGFSSLTSLHVSPRKEIPRFDFWYNLLGKERAGRTFFMTFQQQHNPSQNLLFCNWIQFKVSMLLEANVRYALFCIYTQLKSVSNAVAGQLPGLESPWFLWRVPQMVIIYQNEKRLFLQVTLDFIDSQKDSSSCSNK